VIFGLLGDPVSKQSIQQLGIVNDAESLIKNGLNLDVITDYEYG